VGSNRLGRTNWSGAWRKWNGFAASSSRRLEAGGSRARAPAIDRRSQQGQQGGSQQGQQAGGQQGQQGGRNRASKAAGSKDNKAGLSKASRAAAGSKQDRNPAAANRRSLATGQQRAAGGGDRAAVNRGDLTWDGNIPNSPVGGIDRAYARAARPSVATPEFS